MAKLTPTSRITPIIYPPIDSTTAVQMNKADGTTNVLNVDTTNGRVGIGTTNPSDGRVVAVQSGSSTFSAHSATDAVADGVANVTSLRSVDLDASHWANARYDAYSHAWGYGGSATANTAMTINGSGNVGIGTTGPLANLHIVTSGTTNMGLSGETNTNGAEIANIKFSNLSYGTLASPVAKITARNLTVYDDGDYALAFHTMLAGSLSEKMVITNAGNVGIGTTNPTNLLSLSGQAARIIWTERNVTAATAGLNLTLRVGGAVVGGTNLGGGSLILAGGISTGTGTSDVQIQTCPAGSTGTADNTLTTIIQATGNALGFFGHAVAVQQAYTAVSDPPTQAQVTAIRDALINLGLMAAS